MSAKCPQLCPYFSILRHCKHNWCSYHKLQIWPVINSLWRVLVGCNMWEPTGRIKQHRVSEWLKNTFERICWMWISEILYLKAFLLENISNFIFQEYWLNESIKCLTWFPFKVILPKWFYISGTVVVVGAIKVPKPFSKPMKTQFTDMSLSLGQNELTH